MILAIRPLASATLPHIITPDGSLSFQGIIDGLPVPRLLDWNLGRIERLIDIRDADGPIVWMLAALVIIIVWLRAESVFVPGVKLFSAPHRRPGKHSHAASDTLFPTTLDTDTLLRSLFHIISIALVGAAVGVLAQRLTGGIPSEALATQLRSAIWAITVSVGGFVAGRHSIATARRRNSEADTGVSEQEPSEFGEHSKPPRMMRSMLTGVLFGVVAFLIFRSSMALPSTALMQDFHMLGNFNQAGWNDIAIRYLSSIGAASLAVSLAFFLFACPDLRLHQRAAIGAIVIAIGAAAHIPGRKFDISSFEAQRDITPIVRDQMIPYNASVGRGGVPDGPNAAAELAGILHINRGRQSIQPGRNVILFYPGAIASVRQRGFTEDGLSGDPTSSDHVMQFLKRRDFQTALSWVAIKHLFNVSAIHLDTVGMMRACLLDLERCPHLSQTNPTLREMLFTCAASPENLKVLDEWGDSNRFAYPTRETVRMIGDLYMRFGATDRALQWYHRADMPKTFMARIRRERPLFHDGVIRGELMLNGKPLSGVQVAVVPKRLNGLPKDLEGRVLEADREVEGRQWSGGFGLGFPRPFSFHWVSAMATTGSNGRFQIADLTEGEYSLISTLPYGVRIHVGLLPTSALRNAPARVSLNYAHPTQDIGSVDIELGG